MKAKIIVALMILMAISVNTAAEAFPFGGYNGYGSGQYGHHHHRHHRHCRGMNW